MKSIRNWHIRAAGPDDLNLIRELYRAVREDQRPESYDRWRLFESPYGLTPGALAVEGGRAVGFYPVWPTPLRIGREIVPGGQAMDIMTHPDFRGQGVFVAMAEVCFEVAAARGIRLIYGFPNAASYPGHVRHSGWTHAADILHWFRPIRPSGHPRMPVPLGFIADAAAALWPTGRTRDYIVAAGPVDPARLLALAEGNQVADLCCIERDPAWLAWRYAPAAAQGYEMIAAAKDGKTRAAAVWGMRDETWGSARDGRAHLVELSGTDVDAREATLAQVIVQAQARGAWLLETMTNAPATIRTLRRAGFVAHRSAPFIVRPLREAAFLPDPHEGRNWRIMGGDLDTF